MTFQPLPDAVLVQTWQAFVACDGNQSRTAEKLGISRSTLQNRLSGYKQRFNVHEPGQGYEVQNLPSGDVPIEEIISRRCRDFERKKRASDARSLIPLRFLTDEPIGICHFGDPHVDDDGCDWPALQRHIDVVSATDGLYGANVGDLQNNWVGRLSRLYGAQETSHATAWRLTEWLFRALPWLYLIKGNHDLWSGASDPLDWIKRGSDAVMDAWGCRIALRFPNGREIRVNARHDFKGHSQWNIVHGPSKAAQMGWRDHILTCGHKHESGYTFVTDPASGLISHAIRCGGFKVFDMHAKVHGFAEGAVTPAITTIIDPQAKAETQLVSVFLDVEEAAEFLTWKRSRAAA